jgi:nitronate monooxygenase
LFPSLNSLKISGADVLPLIEGGKGVAVTSGKSSGAWAEAGGVGTISGVNADSYDSQGNIIPQIYSGKTRIDRHQELVKYAIDGGVQQAQIAHEVRKNNGRIHINILWEMGGAEEVLLGILKKTKGLVHGVTCGAGMPYRLGDICASFGVYYYPIISSARAFKILYKRAYVRSTKWLGGVVYEDPWLAGGHNGLSNNEHPEKPEDPYPRCVDLRKAMNEVGLNTTPIVMAGGVWHLRDWKDWINNKELGPVAFQFGTRPLLTKESPISQIWKERLLTLNKGDILLHRFSPTNFYSSAVKNSFIRDLIERKKRQLQASLSKVGEMIVPLKLGKNKTFYFTKQDAIKAANWVKQGFTEVLKTPEDSIVFVSEDKAKEIRKDQKDCMGCLSQCKFSNWSDNSENKYSTGRKVDPRSFCIQKTLQNIAHGHNPDNELMFAGHNAWKFKDDPFYSNGFVPSVKELVNRIASGD